MSSRSKPSDSQISEVKDILGVKELAAQVEQLSRVTRVKSQDELNKEAALAALDQLVPTVAGEDTLLFEGTRFVLPESMQGDIPGAVRYLEQFQEQQETEHEFSRVYPYRPWDGAAAFQRAMKRVFGSTGVGKATFTFFGKIPPRYRTVSVGFGQTMEVPWGEVEFSPLDTTFNLGAEENEDGLCFELSCEAPRKHRRRIEGFMEVVADELSKRSIYRGKAIDAAQEPHFLDLERIRRQPVVYSDAVLTQLHANVWSVLDHSEEMRKHGMPLKRSVLLAGPYGTGKTLAGGLTALHAVEGDWTYILVRAGDDPYEALKTARIYAPAVVWIEDIDLETTGKSRRQIAALLDALDNVQGKGVEVVAGFTTNFPELIDKGVLRPGRIDAVIQVGALDAEATQRLVEVTVPQGLLDANIDWPQVVEAYDGFYPAYAVEATHRAVRYGMARNQGKVKNISTADLVGAANGLRPQLELMNAAPEGQHDQPSLGKLIRDEVEAVNRRTVLDGVGSPFTVVPEDKAKASNGRH